MPTCKNNPTRSYKGTEPSPKGLGYCASGESIGKKRKGKDGKMWIIKEVSNGSGRWMKFSTTTNTYNKKVKKVDKKVECGKIVMYIKKEKGFLGFGSNKVSELVGIQVSNKSIYKFISYNNFENKETIIPDGFMKKTLTKNTIENTYCGSLLAKDNEEYRKIKENHKGFAKYKTHWNGGRPYLCYVKKNNAYYDVYIYKVGDDKNIKNDEVVDGDEDWLYTNFVKYYKAKKIFIGKDSGKYKMSDIGKNTSFSIGNSILLQFTKNKYVVIQENVCEFSTKDEITHYFSLIGRNDVPYPVGVGKENVYFMADLVYIPRKYFPTNMKIADYEESYNLYYNYDYLENNIKIQKNHTKHNFIGKKIVDSAY